MSSKEINTHEEQKLQDYEIKNKYEKEDEEVLKKDNIEDCNEQRIAELEYKLSQIKNNDLLRAKAEVENVRRISEKNVEKAHKFAIESFAIELLPVIDNLERALELSEKSDDILSSIIEGIELTLKSLLNAVRKFGIDVVSETNVPFNPEIHQAMTVLESNEHKHNYVIMVMQKGYTINGRLLRPAAVAVSKNL